MKRILEPEVMDDPNQALAYAEADFDEVNTAYVEAILADLRDPASVATILDLGCGPGDIPRRLATALPGAHITGVDASEPMIALGRSRIAEEGVADRVTLKVARLPLEDTAEAWDVILSNSLLHHLPKPEVLWNEIRRQSHGSGGGKHTWIHVMDLRRPDTPEDAQAIVDTYAADEPDILRRDFYNSLLAAFTPDEVATQLEAAGLAYLEVTQPSDRHLVVQVELCG